jgi:hypothetical protein
MQAGRDDEDGRFVRGAFGSNIASIPESVAREFANPLDFQDEGDIELYPKAKTVRGASEAANDA